MPDSPFDARELVGLLADDGRRSVQRLVDAGLVVRSDDGTLHLLGEAFALAARAVAERAPRSPEHDDEPENVARVLRVFVRDGKLTSIPTVRSKRLVVLDWIAQRFDPGRRYPEATVNLIISAVHPDTAALRRYLVDEGILDREHGEYWRAGGTFDPA